MLKFDGFHKAFMGVAEVWVPTGAGMSLVEKAVYDGYRMVRVLMRKGMTEEDAREYISFNVEGAYLGIETPIIYWPTLTGGKVVIS
jgi:hypothetical protein